MSHELESMLYVGAIPWHKLGKKVSENIRTEDAIKEAGLDWNVKAVPLTTPDGQTVSHRAIMRDKDKSVLGVVGPDYVPLQNTEAFKFFNPFLDAKEANIESAGSLRQGQNIWVMAKLNKAPLEVVKNDIVEKYLLLSNSHKGGISVRVGFTPIRVVCANTLAMAMRNENSQLMRVVHGSQMISNLEKVQEIVNAANAQFEATAEQYKFLASRQVSKSDLEKFVKIVFVPRQPQSQRQQTREDNMIQTITRLFETGQGNNLPGVRGTYWGLYNAATEFLTHEKTKDDDKRLYNLWFGSAHNQNDQALEVALEMAGA